MILFLHSADAQAQLLTVPPYAVSAVVLLIVSYFSDRYQSRGIPISCAASLSGIGYLLAPPTRIDLIRRADKLFITWQTSPNSSRKPARSLLRRLLHHKWDVHVHRNPNSVE